MEEKEVWLMFFAVAFHAHIAKATTGSTSEPPAEAAEKYANEAVEKVRQRGYFEERA